MTECYKELPELYKTFIKEDALDIAIECRALRLHLDYDFFRVHRDTFLTKDGITKFSSCDPMIHVFRVPPNYVGNIHRDRAIGAFNFIITKNGIMEWFNSDELKVSHSWLGNPHFEYSGQTPIASTSMNMFYVATTVPHRIVNNSNNERICLSIRTPIDISVIKL